MYFISKGSVVIISKTFKLQQFLKQGQYFGETCLLNPFGKRLADVYAETCTSCYVLATEDFEELLEEQPDEMVHLLEAAKEMWTA